MLREEKIKIGKYIINYLKVGTGEHSVLCLPGTLGSIWTDFKPQIEEFDREKFTLIVWDAPGYGKSRPPEREIQVDYYGQDVDIAMEFMKALNITKFSIMGWSYGGVTSILIAAKYPEVVNKLVVWGVRAVLSLQEFQIYNKARDIDTWSDSVLKERIEIYGRERLTKLWAQIVDAMESCLVTSDGKVLPSELLRNVRCPTFVLHGEQDMIIDRANLHFLHSNIQGSRIHLYTEGKHNIHLKYAEDFNQRVQEFLLEEEN